MQNLLNQFLLGNPFFRLSFAMPTILLVGILGEIFSWNRLPWFPYSNFLGGALFLGGWAFHLHCHKTHKQAHEQSEQIERIVTDGVFSKIRHPMYLGLIIMYWGGAMAWGIVWMLLPAFLFSALIVLMALREEAFLLEKFGRQYALYQQSVPWRFIPGIF